MISSKETIFAAVEIPTGPLAPRVFLLTSGANKW